MIKVNKYKLFKITRFFFQQYPWRILRFRREKWFELKQKLNNLKRRKKFRSRFINLSKKKVKTKRWLKIKTLYKRELNSKRILYILFNRSINVKFLKQQTKNSIKYLDSKTFFVIKPYFRHDVLLWKLNFFNSTSEARQAIFIGKIILNKKKRKTTKFLLKGDTTEINKYFFSLKTIRKKYSKNRKFLTFIEIDYYTNTLILVKHFKDLWIDDFPLITQESFLTKSLKHVF